MEKKVGPPGPKRFSTIKAQHFERPEIPDGKHISLQSSQPTLFKTVLAVIAYSLIQPKKIAFKPS